MANKFEKEVQKTLRELHFTPTPSVWQHVETKINARKKRRRLLFLLMMIAIPAVFLVFYFSLNSKNQVKLLPSKEAIVKSNEQKAHAKIKADEGQNHDSLQLKGQSTMVARTGDYRKRAAEQSDAGLVETKLLSTADSYTGRVPAITEGHDKGRLTKKVLSLDFLGQEQQKKFIESPDPEKQSTPVQKLSINIDNPLQKESEGHTSKTELKATERRWQLAVSFRPGISFLNKSLLSLQSATGSPNYSNDPGNSSGTPQVPGYIAAPDISSAPAFSLFFTIKKPLSEKLAFKTGLGYQYFGLHQQMKTGSAISGYDTSYFTNRLHYLTLPIGLQFETNIARIPLNWELGTGLSHLLSANALQFGSTGYYKNNSLLHSFQVPFHISATLTLLQSKTYRLSAGPYYQYNLNQPAKKGIFSDRHLNVAGFKADIEFINIVVR